MTEDQFFLNPGADSSASGGASTNAETVECNALFRFVGKQIGPYRLIKQIGQGGMGAVYLAEQDEPIHRQVALKVIKPDTVSDSILARFNAERDVLSLMNHPNIAQVLDAGLAEGGLPYFVMELVLGLPITQYCDRHRLDVHERARLMVTVCQAVQHAHQKGIIHRDIKPSNVLVMTSNNGPIPKVIDFGVAKAIEAQNLETPDLTVVGHAVGTPLYMSPEQAGLSNCDVDTRSDVYSLGVLLFELVTGTTPISNAEFREMGPAELRAALLQRESPCPSNRLRELGVRLPTVAKRRSTDSRTLVQAVRHDLDQIICKATSKDRDQRYPTANGLARDIERYLAHEPIEATTLSPFHRLQRLARRYRGMLASACIIGCVLVVATIISTWQAYRAADALRLVEASSRRLAELLYVSDMKVASDAWKDNDPPRVAGLLARHVPAPGAADLRHFEWHYLSRIVDIHGRQIDWIEDDVESICYSVDGLRFAVGGRDGVIRVYDASNFERIGAIETQQGRVNDVAFSPDGETIASAGQDGTVRLWSRKTGESRLTIPAHDEPVRSVVYAHEGTQLISCGLDKRIRLWDATDGTDRGELKGHVRGVEALALSPDEQRLASAGNDGTLRIWDLQQLSLVRNIHFCDARMVCVAFSHNGELVASGDIFGNVILHHLPSNDSRILVRLLDGVECLTFLTDDRWLGTGDRGGTIQLWPVTGETDQDIGLGRETYPRWQAHNTRVNALALTPDGTRFLSGSRGGQISAWPSTPMTCRWSIGTPEIPADDFAFLCEEHYRLAVARGKTIEVWDLAERRKERHWSDPRGPWVELAASHSRDILVAGNENGELVAWQPKTGEEIANWTPTDSVKWERIVFAPDGHTFAVAAWDQLEEARLFDVDNPNWSRRLPARQSDCVAFSPDGQYVAVAWMDDGLIYDLRVDEAPRELLGHSSTLCGIAFSPDGESVATISHDRKLRLWEARSGFEKYTIVAHQDWGRDVAFSPDGWSLATCGDDGVVRLWHTETGQLLLELPKEGDGILKVEYCSTGRCLVYQTAEDRVVICDSRRWEAGVPSGAE